MCINPGTVKQPTPHSQNQFLSQNNTPLITTLSTIKPHNTTSNQFNQHHKTIQLKSDITKMKMTNGDKPVTRDERRRLMTAAERWRSDNSNRGESDSDEAVKTDEEYRFSLPLLQQQLRPHQKITPNSSCANNNNHNTVQNQVQAQDSEKKMFNCLQELEKQLLDDNEEEGDAVSVITKTNSEWSETIQNLLSPKSISLVSSTSPTSSYSSSSSMASPIPSWCLFSWMIGGISQG